MSKVFITQQNLTRDPGTGGWRPRFDLSPAQEYGQLEFIFGAGQIALMPEAVEDAIEQRLDELGYDPDNDYLLNTGDMTIANHATYLMMLRGGCRLLRWDGKYRRYTVYNIPQREKVDER